MHVSTTERKPSTKAISMKRFTAFTLLSALAASLVLADGPADNDPKKVRRIPKLGIEITDEDRAELETDLARLKSAIQRLQQEEEGSRIRQLLPDIQIFHVAVDSALRYREFFTDRDVRHAMELLQVGLERAEQLSHGHAPWTSQTGLVVRGYVSKLDGSVQPYGLVVPESYQKTGTDPVRCDLWFHGRGETLSEVNFLSQRMSQVGQYAPKDTIVLHPYGRYSNAFKFAGEVDVLEALDSVKQRYRIDDDRISVRGFSMGGAACWQFAVHYADRWFAANPGAGFSETPEFLKVFQGETLDPTWYERKLWHLYDCTDYAVNLFHCPTVAYSGEIDRQRQAAEIMAGALKRENINLTHVIGPNTAHRIHAESKPIIEDKLRSLALSGRERLPNRIKFVTWTLKYNRMHWVTIDALDEHWEQARIEAEYNENSQLAATTRKIAALTFSMPAGECPFDITKPITLNIDGQSLVAPQPQSDRSWQCSIHRTHDRWQIGPLPANQLRKKPGLQGPIDDAFMDAFVIVRPTQPARNRTVDDWAQAELRHAVEHWRRHFRGEARVKNDTEISEEDIEAFNLILFGDSNSNLLINRVADQLPISWDDGEIHVGERSFSSAHHAPLLIYPNPLNPSRYIVLNSGFTYREYDYLNNARQVPKLPDWAIVDLRTPPHSRGPGRIADAGFFGEQWQLKSHPTIQE